MKEQIITAEDVLRGLPRLRYFGGKPAAYFVLWALRINKLNKMYLHSYQLDSSGFVDQVMKDLGFKYSLNIKDLKNIPTEGAFILIGNHPFGGAEAIITLQLMKRIRPDFKYMANFLLNNIDPLKPYFIAVNPFETMRHLKSSYTGLKLASDHISHGKALGIFPAGEVSSYQKEAAEITDKKWPLSIMKFIKSQQVPVIPIYYEGRNSKLFYFLGKIHPLLRTAKLASELLNKKNQLIKIKIGKVIDLNAQMQYKDIDSYTDFLRESTYALKEKNF